MNKYSRPEYSPSCKARTVCDVAESIEVASISEHDSIVNLGEDTTCGNFVHRSTVRDYHLCEKTLLYCDDHAYPINHWLCENLFTEIP